MGSKYSQQQLDEDSDDEVDNAVYDPKLIQWDENGNVIFGNLSYYNILLLNVYVMLSCT